MSRTLAVICAVIIALGVAGCGESDEEKANRLVLAPLVQRHQASTSEYATWEGESDSTAVRTWKDSFDQHERLIETKEKIRTDLQGVVPTPKFACVHTLLERSVAADLRYLRARYSATKQHYAAESAGKQGDEYYAKGMAAGSYYLAKSYLEHSQEAFHEAVRLQKESIRFAIEGNTAARMALATGDSLHAVVAELAVLPTSTRPRYPVMKHDSAGFPGPMLFAPVTAPRVRCEDVPTGVSEPQQADDSKGETGRPSSSRS